MQDYVEKAIVSYVQEQRKAHDLPLRHCALVTMDVFRTHHTDNVLEARKSVGSNGNDKYIDTMCLTLLADGTKLTPFFFQNTQLRNKGKGEILPQH